MRLSACLRFMFVSLCLGAAAAPRAAESDEGNHVMLELPGLDYAVQDGAVVRENGPRFHNRPLYGDHIPTVLLAGDRPHFLFAHDPYVAGAFMLAFRRDDTARWLHDFAQIRMEYRDGRVEYLVSDPAFPGLTIRLAAVTLDDAPGFALRLATEGADSADRLLWAAGGARRMTTENLFWQLDPVIHPEVMQRSFAPEDARFNQFAVEGDRILIHPPHPTADVSLTTRTLIGRASVASALRLADASAWQDPIALAASSAGDLPLAVAEIPMATAGSEIYWVFRSYQDEPIADDPLLADPRAAFEAGAARLAGLAARVRVKTPDPFFDLAAANLSLSIDGTWQPPVFVHGALAWNIPFPGWRTTYGPTAYGRHAEVAEQAAYYITSQSHDESTRTNRAEPTLGLTLQATDSRFYGRGHIDRDQNFYNFQTQFFDQAIHAWRWTGDARLAALLRPALELHLEWLRDCFDPDGNGLYEGYVETWPTDSVWYNGGEGAQTTSYAYNGHRAAAELAAMAGDDDAAARHTERAEQIRAALNETLWLADRGHLAEYRESMGARRLHDDACLYSIFLPIDNGLLEPLAALQSLNYTRSGLERVPMPFGGERCWTSNWVPSVWSVRELYLGENSHLALACFQAGLPAEGWSLLRANALNAMFTTVPGGASVRMGGTDFNDATSMLARVIVEGFFGFRPDRPNGAIRIAPGFPADWDHAEITTPDFSLAFSRDKGGAAEAAIDRYAFSLAEGSEPTRLAFDLPVRGAHIERVLVGGQPVHYSTEPGIGLRRVRIEIDDATAAEISIAWSQPLTIPEFTPLRVEAGAPLALAPAAGKAFAWDDPQAVLASPHLEGGELHATAAAPGNRLVRLRSRLDDGGIDQLFALEITDTAAETARRALDLREPPAGAAFTPLDVAPIRNGDVRAIYLQQYLTPRVDTCSVQLGINGYGPWTFWFWNFMPPEIKLDAVAGMLDPDGRLVTPQGVPFAWPAGGAEGESGAAANIAFVSHWDNWPDAVELPVAPEQADGADAIWLLVAGSTNPMQTGIANGRFSFTFDDGSSDSLDLVHPDNYWMLTSYGGSDYNYERDGFALPDPAPLTVQLGEQCRAMLLGRPLPAGRSLRSIRLEALSQEVVIGLLGATLQATNP